MNEVVDTTTQNTDVEYFTSEKRAKNVAANEANAVGNYRLQTEMVKQGYKTKEWRSKEDSHVRPTHAEVDRKRIDIFTKQRTERRYITPMKKQAFQSRSIFGRIYRLTEEKRKTRNMALIRLTLMLFC